jgi:hypothetical protein
MSSMVIVVNSVVGGATVALVFALAIKTAAPVPAGACTTTPSLVGENPKSLKPTPPSPTWYAVPHRAAPSPEVDGLRGSGHDHGSLVPYTTTNDPRSCNPGHTGTARSGLRRPPRSIAHDGTCRGLFPVSAEDPAPVRCRIFSVMGSRCCWGPWDLDLDGRRRRHCPRSYFASIARLRVEGLPRPTRTGRLRERQPPQPRTRLAGPADGPAQAATQPPPPPAVASPAGSRPPPWRPGATAAARGGGSRG